MKTYLLSLWRLLFPSLCIACQKPLVETEQAVCLCCLHGMPRTSFSLLPDNPVEQLFWGKVFIHKAMGWCFFVKGGVMQSLLHALKYKNRPQVGVVLGRQLALENKEWFEGMDALIPIPLHAKRLRSRGYNQSACIAQGISQVTGIPICEQVLQRKVFTQTQTRKRVYQRWQNMERVFDVSHAHLLEGKHVLLIDDVITTGATLASAALTLQENIPQITVSIATIAVASS